MERGDIEKLQESNIGITCLTRENAEKPWILFEAGALSKNIEGSRLCSILFGLETTDLKGPLTTFQTTQFEKADIKKLMRTINDAAADARLNDETFADVFDMWWPRLQKSVETILNKERPTDQGDLRSDRDILEEILSLSRVTSRREAPLRQAPRISAGALAAQCDAVATLANEASQYGDSDIADAAGHILDAVIYMSRGLRDDDRLYKKIEIATDALSVARQHIQSQPSPENEPDDDEIPF